MNYNINMKVELFAKYGEDSELVLLDTFEFDDVKTQYENEQKNLANEANKKKKSKNETEEGEEEKVEENDEEVKIENPKVKITVEFSRSGVMKVTKAKVGNLFLNDKKIIKSSQLDEAQMRQAKSRNKWYTKRDENKIKRDIAMNDFESTIYAMKDWLREDENFPYVKEDVRDTYMEQLTEMEDWLYEDGANQNHTVYEKKTKDMMKDFNEFKGRKEMDQNRAEFVEKTHKQLNSWKTKTEDL